LLCPTKQATPQGVKGFHGLEIRAAVVVLAFLNMTPLSC